MTALQKSIVYLTLLFSLAQCVGCYSAHNFVSDSADILLNSPMGSPEYQIVFLPLEVQDGTSEANYWFSSPPPYDRVEVGLQIRSFDDISVLHDAGAVVHIVIRDESGDIVFDETVPMPSEAAVSTRDNYGVQPPTDWLQTPKGQIVRARDVKYLAEPGPYWTDGRQYGKIASVGRAKLKQTSYHMTVRIVLDRSIDEPIIVYPVLAGGWRVPL